MTVNPPTNLNEMAAAMLTCQQTKGQSVFQHGISVQEHVFDLIDQIKYDHDLKNWCIPKCIESHGKQIVTNLHETDVIAHYTLYHDCGKPYCRVEDESGVHFPDHAAISEKIWLSVGGNTVVGKLIGHDMDLHTLTAEELEQRFAIWSIQDACTLLLVALAEVHSNAKMFGGTDSVSFKSKFKKLERRGSQICRHYF